MISQHKAASRRNDFIPRLLLGRFASRRIGKKKWIWQIGKDGSATEISVRDVAVSVDFYGGASTGLETTFQKLETKFDQALTAIEAGDNPQSHAEVLTALLWTLSTRTRALRSPFETMGLQVLSAMCESAVSQEARQAGIRAAKAAIDRKIDKQLSTLVPSQRSAAMRWLDSGGRAAMHESAERFAESVDLAAGAQEIAAQMKSEGVIQKSARSGQLNGLQRALAVQRLPTWLTPRWWAVCIADPGTFILGDSCVVARSTHGQMGVPMQFGHEEWHTLYLPISSSKVLAAGYGVFAREVSADELNRAFAQLSSSYIYSATFHGGVSDLGRTIAAGNQTMNDRDIQSMVSEVWKSLQA